MPKAEAPPSITYAQQTDRGRVRENNEDFMSAVPAKDDHTANKKGNLFIVADGLGGLASGEIASREAVEGLEKAWGLLDRFEGPQWIKDTFRAVNAAIFKVNQARGLDRMMATTLTASFFHQKHLCIGHVGDCRVYRIRGRTIHRLTQDHALDRHTITRTIGGEPDVEVDVYELLPEKGDIYIQCSDGLYSMIPETEVLKTVIQNTPKKSCEALVRLANAYGGADNITVQVIHYQ